MRNRMAEKCILPEKWDKNGEEVRKLSIATPGTVYRSELENRGKRTFLGSKDAIHGADSRAGL